jgi:hypothetical protein
LRGPYSGRTREANASQRHNDLQKIGHFQEIAQGHRYSRLVESLVSSQSDIISSQETFDGRRTGVSLQIEVDGEEFIAFEL